MRFDIITIFPHILDSYISESILGRAQKKKIIKIQTHNLRNAAKDKHKRVDDKPYGGGPGMVMMAEPIYRTLKKIKRAKKSKVILLDPKGEEFNQKMAEKFAKLDQLIFVCGRYEGIDARIEKFVDGKISVGRYVLSGGELGAGIIIEAVSRLISGVLGNQKSLAEETFNKSSGIGNLELEISKEYPQYTRPEVFQYKKGVRNNRLAVPKVLLSGNHQEIEKWRKKYSQKS